MRLEFSSDEGLHTGNMYNYQLEAFSMSLITKWNVGRNVMYIVGDYSKPLLSVGFTFSKNPITGKRWCIKSGPYEKNRSNIPKMLVTG
jgi:hypothetical protein